MNTLNVIETGPRVPHSGKRLVSTQVFLFQSIKLLIFQTILMFWIIFTKVR